MISFRRALALATLICPMTVVAETPTPVMVSGGLQVHGHYQIGGWFVECTSSDNVPFNCSAFARTDRLPIGEVSYAPAIRYYPDRVEVYLFAGDRDQNCLISSNFSRSENGESELIEEIVAFLDESVSECEQPDLTPYRKESFPELSYLLLRATQDH